MKKLSVIVILFFTLSSCQEKIEEVLEGDWSIDTLYYKGEDITVCMPVNIISFYKERKCDLPSTSNCEGLGWRQKSNTWQINNNKGLPIQLLIESGSDVFAGTYRISFKKDEKN